jgi:voltage-gated potassium channel Kch
MLFFANRQDSSLSVLLALQITAIFVVGPAIEIIGVAYRWTMNINIALMALVSVFVVSRPLARWITIACFASCLFGSAIGSFLKSPITSQFIVSMSAMFFFVTISWIVGHRILRSGSVTLHHIQGAMVIYLNIALTFAMIYSLLETNVPGAFLNLPMNSHKNFGPMVYFSLTTLTTTGYGDILPVHPFARSLANLEAVTGQFYLGALIATLVGLRVSHRQNNKQ